MGYRWAILAAGVFAQMSLSAIQQGLPALGPELRDELHLSLSQVGVVLACVSWGITITLLGWGWLADRVGERPVVTVGLAGGAAALVGAAYASGFGALVATLTLAGALAGCTSIASGRAVMGWFGRHERGLALGLRQMAVPLGGAVGALTLPALADAGGLKAAFLALAGGCAAGALACALVFREPAERPRSASRAPAPLRDGRIWRLGIASGLYVVSQISVISFTVLFLHEHRHVATAAAAGVLGAMQIGGAASRAVAGWRSDRSGARIPLMRRIGVLTSLALLATGALADAPLALLIPVLLIAGLVGMSWNGLSVTAAAELSGPERTGAALGLQQTLVALAAGTGVIFAAVVDRTGWAAAFALLALPSLAGWWLLRPLAAEESRRLRGGGATV